MTRIRGGRAKAAQTLYFSPSEAEACHQGADGAGPGEGSPPGLQRTAWLCPHMAGPHAHMQSEGSDAFSSKDTVLSDQGSPAYDLP